MKKISGRYVNVMRTSEKVSIMLSWLVEQDDQPIRQENKQIVYPSSQVLESVEDAINKIVDRWIRVFISSVHMSAISDCLDNHPQKFDLIRESEEPEQAFVSRYILGE